MNTLLSQQEYEKKRKTFEIDVHPCVLKTHLLPLIKNSVIERHNVIFEINMVLLFATRAIDV